MSEERVLSDFVWTPERGENDPEVRSISWNNLLLSDEVYGGKFLTSSEIRINPDTALQSTVFLACCRIISETVASLPIHVYRRLKSGHEEIAHEIPLYHVLTFAPNSWQTKFEFFEQMVMALTCWGNSYTEVNSGKYGAVTELNNLHPSRMRVERLENGRLKYSYNDPQTGRLLQYTQDQIMHVRWTPEPDGVKGMVPVEVSRDAIALSRACEIYASKFWANMGRPGIVLQTDGALSAETAERLRDNWERIHRGVQNAYKTAVLTNGLKVESFGATNNDSQFLEVRRFQCEEIARVFRLSLGLIQGTSTGGNLEVQGQEFINYTLMPWLNRIEQAISRSLIYDDAVYYAKFDTRGLLRGDSNSRAAYYSTMLNLGILSINECRKAEGLGPLGPEADKHLVAMNLQPLEEAVKPKPDPSMMPGFGSGAPPKAPGGPPSLSEVKTGKAPIESPKGEDSAKRSLDPRDAELEEAHVEIAEEEGKWSKESAHYIEKNPFAARGIKCHNCTHYVEEGGCKIVSGLIGGDAICKLWVIPQEKITQEPEQRAFCPTGPGGGVKNDCGSKDGGSGSVSADEAKEKFERYRPFRSVGDSKNSDYIRIPSDEEISSVLTDADVQQSKIGASREVPDDTPVALRIDIPAWDRSGGKTYVVTVHEGKNPDNKKPFGPVIGYDSMAALSGPVRFSANNEDRAQKVAEGKSKTPLATVNGKFSKSREIPKDIDSWTPVGYDPQKAVYFYDKRTGQEIIAGTDAVSVGNTVFTREPKYGKRNAKTHYRSLEEMMAVDSWGLESRGFCPTGEGGGIDNSCGSGDKGPKADSDKGSGEGGDDEDLPGGGEGSGPDDGGPPKGGDPTGGDNFEAVADEILRSIEATGGYSVHPITAESPTTGYMVSTVSQAEEKIAGLENVTGDRIREYFNNHKDYLSKNPQLHLGGWFNLEDGLVYLDLSERFEDIDDAIDKAVEKNQLAIWDLNTKSEIRKEDYDGRRTRKKEPRSVRLPAGGGPGRDRGGDPQGGIQAPGGEGSEGGEARAFCATGEGGGVDNSCSAGESSPGSGWVASSTATATEEQEPQYKEAATPPSRSGWKRSEGVTTWSREDLQSSKSPSETAKSLGSLTIVGGKWANEALSNVGVSLDDVIEACSFPDESSNVVIVPGEPAQAFDVMSGKDNKVGFLDEITVTTVSTLEGSDSQNHAMTSLRRHEDGTLEMKLIGLLVADDVKQNNRVAAARRILDQVPRMIANAERLGVDKVSLRAAGDSDNEKYQGYKIWPRIGFDGAIPRKLVTSKYTLMKGVFNSYGDRIPDSILSPRAKQEKASGKLTIQALYETKAGQRWWERNGGDMPMSLDIKDKESPGMKAFEKSRARIGNRSLSEFLLSESRSLNLFWPAWLERRAYCPTGEGNGIDNSCSSSEGGAASSAVASAVQSPEKSSSPAGPLKWTPGDPTGDITSRVMAAPPTVRSADGKTIESTSIPDAHIYPFAGRQWVSTIDAGAYLSSMQDQVRGGVINTATGRGELSRESLDYITTAIADQGITAANRGIVPLFYSPEELERQLQEFSSLIPQVRGGRMKDGTLIEQEDAEHLFRVVQALTSPNATPFANMQRTDSLLRKFFEGDGRITTGDSLGVTGPGIRKSLQRFQAIVDTLGRRTDGRVDVAAGLAAARQMLQHQMLPAKEIDKFFADFKSAKDSKDAWKPGNYLMGETVPVFSTFGPKVGPFYENNQGNLDPLTADVWFTRTWGRVTGELVVPGKSSKAVEHAERLIDAFKKASDEHYHGIAPEELHDSIRRTTQNGVVDDVLRAWAEDRLAHYAAGGYKEKTGVGGKLNSISKNIVENDTSLMGDPGAGSRRSNMIKVMREASARTGLPVAYLQDVLWQDEQDAYAALGAKTATGFGQLSLYSDQIRRIAQDQKNNRRPMASKDRSSRRAYKEAQEDSYRDYERGGREQMLWDVALAKVSDQEFADAVIALAEGGKESRGFCPTGEGGGIDNSCGSDGKAADGEWAASSTSETTSSTVKIGDKQEEIDSRLAKMGVNMGDVMAMAGGGADGVYTFIRRDQEKPSENGIHIETTRDVAGVRDGMFTTTVIRNAGTESDPEIVVDYKLMEVEPAVSADPEKRHAAAREFFRTMTGSVEAAMKAGASKVVLFAAGDSKDQDEFTFRGYTIWPRMGFDAPIPFNLKNKLPKDLDHCRTLLDLHATREGTRWWRDNGADLELQLDLKRADSPQMQVFGRFVRHFERDTRDLAYGTGDGWLSPADQAKLDELWEEIWDEGLLDDYSGEEELRAFCPTGEGGGIDNSCSASDSSSGSEWVAASTSSPTRTTADWGQTSGTEIWTPAKPLFKGSDRVASIKIDRAAEVREIAEEFGLGISEVTDASGPVSESTERAHVTLPRVVIAPTGNGIQISWTCRGATTGEGYAPHEKPFAEPKDTVVNAVSAYRAIERSPTSGLTLTLGSFDIHPDFQGKGIALEMTGRVVSAPVDTIIMTAARQDDPNPRMRMTGYSAWPKYGYNAHINSVKAVLQAKGVDLPDEFGHCRSLLDLFATPGGPEFWREHGDTITLRFDKRPRSQSYTALFANQDRIRRKIRMEEPWTKPAIGSDCDYDPEIDAAWAEIQSNGGLDGLPPEEPEDGDPREVQPH